MSAAPALGSTLMVLARRALAVVLAAATVLGGAALVHPAVIPHILPAYLTALLYLLAMSLGSCVLLLIHALTGGRWGMAVGRILSAAVAPLPLLAVLFTIDGEQSFARSALIFLERATIRKIAWILHQHVAHMFRSE